MDPIGMARSAFDILKQLKEELRACEEAFAEARDFRDQVERMEIIVMMIPNNDKDKEEMIEKEEVKVKEEEKIKKPSFASFGKEKLKQQVLDMTGLGEIIDILKGVAGAGEEIELIYSSDGEARPGEVLRAMKSCPEFSKLDVMFQG